MPDNLLPSIRAGVVCRHAGDDAIVYSPSGEQVLAISARGAQLLAACDGATTVADFAQQACWHPAEVAEVLAELQQLELVELTDGTTRRTLLQRGAVVGGGIVIATLAAPMAAAHATGDITNNPATGGEYYGACYTYSENGYYYYYPMGTQVAGLNPGDTITGFEFEVYHNSTTFPESSDNLVFAVIDEPATNQMLAETANGLDTITAPVPFSNDEALVTGFSHIVPASGIVVLAIYPVANSGRYFTYVRTGNDDDAVYDSTLIPGQGYSTVFTLYGHSASGGGLSQSGARHLDGRGAAPTKVLASQGQTGLAIPQSMILKQQHQREERALHRARARRARQARRKTK